jgi:SAM-dependent methyltransferase
MTRTAIRIILTALRITLVLVGGLAFFWLVVLKLMSRLAARMGHSSPCPASLSWIVNNPVRRRYMRPILGRVGIRPGERVLELGPGPGAFTLDAARRAGPEGRLVVVDIQPEMIAQVERRVRAAGLANVETHVASAYDLPLDDASVDRAFLITVLPEIPDRRRALAELRRVLRSPEPAEGTPGGVLSITEEFLDPDYLFASETIRLVEASGFRLEGRAGNCWLYTLNFRKPA